MALLGLGRATGRTRHRTRGRALPRPGLRRSQNNASVARVNTLSGSA